MLLSASMVIAMMADAATAAPKADKNEPDKLICRRYATTGSLIGSKRVCRTREDWSRVEDAARRNVEELQAPKNGTNQI